MSTTTATIPTCTITARVEGPVTQRDAAHGFRSVLVPCGRPAASYSEADGHRSNYCPEHATWVESKGLYVHPIR